MNTNLLLALDTSDLRCGVALMDAERNDLLGLAEDETRHSGGLVTLVQSLLAQRGRRVTDVATVAFAGGPGSFTGLRISCAFVRMLQAMTACRVVRVGTLAAIAEQTRAAGAAPERLAVLLDAKSGAAFSALYECAAADEIGGYLEVLPPALRTLPELAALLPAKTVIVSAGQRRAAGELADRFVQMELTAAPRVAAVARLGCVAAARGAFTTPDEIVPLYLRPPECEEVYELRRAAARAKRLSEPRP